MDLFGIKCDRCGELMDQAQISPRSDAVQVMVRADLSMRSVVLGFTGDSGTDELPAHSVCATFRDLCQPCDGRVAALLAQIFRDASNERGE